MLLWFQHFFCFCPIVVTFRSRLSSHYICCVFREDIKQILRFRTCQSLILFMIFCIFERSYASEEFMIKRIWPLTHYSDVIMSVMASQITNVSIVCSTVCSSTDQWKQESYASLAFVSGIHHRWPIYFPHKGPVIRKIFPFDNVIMIPVMVNWLPLYHFRQLYYEICDQQFSSSDTQ